MRVGVVAFTIKFTLFLLKTTRVDSKVTNITFENDGAHLTLDEPRIVRANIYTDSSETPLLRWIYYSNATGRLSDMHKTSEIKGPTPREDGSFIFKAQKTFSFREVPKFVGREFTVGFLLDKASVLNLSNIKVEFPAPWELKMNIRNYITLVCKGQTVPRIVEFVGKYNHKETNISVYTCKCMVKEYPSGRASCNITSSSFTISIGLDIVAKPLLNGSLWRCRNAKSYSDGSRFLLIDLEHPDHKTFQILGYTSGQLLHADGSNFSVCCLIEGGKPFPNLTFECANEITGEHFYNKTHEGLCLHLRQNMDLHDMRCKCSANQSFNDFSSVKKLSFNVVYAPHITVTTNSATDRDRNVSIKCSVRVNPVIKEVLWEQRIGNIVVRNSSILKKYLLHNSSDLILPFVTYRDSGVYWCMANNGIQTDDHSAWNSESATLKVKAPALFLPTTMCFSGSLAQLLQIEIPFFCEFCDREMIISLSNDDTKTQIENTSDYTLSVGKRPVTFSMYGTVVQREGFSFHLRINNMRKKDVGQYKLTIGVDEVLQSSAVFTVNEVENSDTLSFSPLVLILMVVAWALSLVLVIPTWRAFKTVKLKITAKNPPVVEDRYDNEGYFLLPDNRVLPRRRIPATELSEQTYIEMVSHTFEDEETQTDI